MLRKKNKQVGTGLVIYAVVTVVNRLTSLPEVVYKLGLVLALVFILVGLYSINRDISKRQRS